jgi:hypothetical protein
MSKDFKSELIALYCNGKEGNAGHRFVMGQQILHH